jgi:arylsulfatase A-like enzyme
MALCGQVSSAARAGCFPSNVKQGLNKVVRAHDAADLENASTPVANFDRRRGVDVRPASYLDAIAVAIVCGTVVGAADAATVRFNLFGARGGVPFVPWTIWPASIAAWSFLLAAIAMIAGSVPRLRKFVVPVAFVVGPGILLSIRILQFRYQLLAQPPLLAAVIALIAVIVALGFWSTFAWNRREPVRRFVRQLAYAPLLLIGLASVSLFSARSAAAATSAPLAASRKNVVLIFLDTVRYDYSGVSDEGRGHAPNLHAFASDAMRFEYAMAPAPWTVPSHVSVLTGLPVWQLGITSEHQAMQPTAMTLPKRFAREGYDTAAFIANPILHDHTGVASGFRRYEYSERSLDFCRTSLGVIVAKFSQTRGACAWTSRDVSEKALDYIGRTNKPYFLLLNYFDAHDPYWLPAYLPAEGPRRLSMRDHAELLRVITRGVPLPPDTHARVTNMYGQAIRGMDSSMQLLLQRLDADVKAGRTIVAIVGDHGEQFGEHNFCGHGNSLYAQVLRVPMILKARGLEPMRVATVASPTRLYDALPTLAMSDVAPEDSRVLTVFGSEPAMSHIKLDAGPAWSAAAGGYHLIESAGKLELYNITADPAEVHDLIGQMQVPSPMLAAIQRAKSEGRSEKERGSENMKGIGYLP